jgi:acyl carrier protein
MEEKRVTINRNNIYEMISSILGIDIDLVKGFNENADFAVHGMTSISAIQLVAMLEEKYDFEFRDEDLLIDRFNTFNKLFSLLESY